RLGKEAAMFVPSGTMGNTSAVITHCPRGDEVVLGDRAHILLYEGGGAATFGGLPLRTVPNLENGALDPAQVERTVQRATLHTAGTGLLCLENSHNDCGGRVVTMEQMQRLSGIARQRGVPVHLDGARVFNAALALSVQASEIAAYADSVMFCLSKGLSAPVGSLLTGTREFITRARRTRKMLGGGMRQSGVLAAAGIVALEQMVDRLAEDHANARRLAEGLAEIRGLHVDPTTVETNMVFFSLRHADGMPLDQQPFMRAAREAGVLVIDMGPGRIRTVTHYGITAEHIDTALGVFSKICREQPSLVGI
ncbi:MAG TPA: GntG family PLP-dependent aldolase, partial [Ktedonobacterales bacterium]|nr:GntG family PLP-dependent aldolase [Ktedonobacterales bacterium]